MTLLPALTAFVFYLLVSCSGVSSQRLPNCSKTDKFGTIALHLVRMFISQEVDAIKSGMRYSCPLEKLAYNLVKDPMQCIGTSYQITFSNGCGSNINIREVVKEWKEQLTKMRRVREFGCNINQGDHKYKIACVFK
ncbi:hypothetical protein Y032_0234g3130 [Ancylostoma ceylanicum]|uniref:SCP domain-containing protein n=1 Tax=Ancylostoma ceylanicum TaxID=53326 RepID=A0A016SET7_9BILA|nr:hypothetical protein Y032_0234g3130 [Ancylostoma ceylanicum]